MDTNAVIDFMAGRLPEANLVALRNVPHAVSVITRIELLAWPDAKEQELYDIQEYLNHASILPLSENVILHTIQIRRHYRLKLPDAVIAASALNLRARLISRNLKDYSRVAGLDVRNPHEEL